MVLVLLVSGGIGALVYFGGVGHGVGFAQYAAVATSPLAAFRANEQFTLDHNHAATYYYFDADGRTYLDELANEHGLRDGIELFAKLNARPTTTHVVEGDPEQVKAMIRTGERLKEWAESMIEFDEEINGDRGAVLIRSKQSGRVANRIEMVRESGVWHHPMTNEERRQIKETVDLRLVSKE